MPRSVPHTNAQRALSGAELRNERELREQRALALGPADSHLLRLVADDMDASGEGIVELPGVDAERLRLLARQLEQPADPDDEVEALRAHATCLHRALCDAIADLDDGDLSDPVFVIVAADVASDDALSLDVFSDLAVFLLDEIE